MRTTRLTRAVHGALFPLAAMAFAALQPAYAQTQPVPAADADEGNATAELETIRVTGSLIPQAQKETASPVTVITAEQIERQGFRNVYDVLRSQPLATGAVQDNQFTNGFTPGANTISLLGLDPGFTLVLIDGRPLADYPLLYNSQSNFTDLSSIPTGMVERIDILPGNQSAIYGSSAIAGVVNIILKRNLQGLRINARAGGYDDGGGSNQRLQLTGGNSWDRLDVTYGLQFSQQDPIFAYQRKWSDSTDDNPDPNGRFGTRVWLISDGFTNQYDDPGQAACAALAGNYGGSVIYDLRPGNGNYCGSRAQPAFVSLLNDERGGAGYVNSSVRIDERRELYGSLLYGVSRTETDSGSRVWVPDVNGSGGLIFNQSAGTLDAYQRIFAPEETGGVGQEINRSHSYSAALGSRGAIGDSDWDYDAYYARSQFDLENRQLWPLTGPIEDFFRAQFLGPQLGTYYGYAVYEPDRSAFYQALTPQQYRSFLGRIQSDSNTWTHNVNAQVNNGNLFELPAGPVAMAALVQAGYQNWRNATDQRVIDGEFWGLTATQGAGKRSNAAIAFEFLVPIFSSLNASISARYDRYKNIDAGSDAKPTFKLGLEYRPLDELLIRGNYATAFRAPDMAYIYAGEAGFFANVNDYYRCSLEQPGPLDDCDFSDASVQASRNGNRDLKSITADSYGFGVVWSPSPEFDLRADYYNINIDDEVNDISIDRLLLDELACRGTAGTPATIPATDNRCIEALARIVRNPADAAILPNALRTIRINPINISSERVAGVIAGSNYRWDSDRAGAFDFALDYNIVLDHEYQQYPDSENLDLLDIVNGSSEFRSILTGDITWSIGDWTTSLHAIRYGSSANRTAVLGFASNNGVPPGRIGPHMLYNLSVGYDLSEDSTLSLTVNNLRNSAPPRDQSFTTYPYYNRFNYNGFGRAYWLTYDLQFGG